MVRLDTDLDLQRPVESLTIEPDYPAVIAALEGFEFRGLLAEYRAEAKAKSEQKSETEAQEELFPF